MVVGTAYGAALYNKFGKKGGGMKRKADREAMGKRNLARTIGMGDEGGDFADMMQRLQEGYEGPTEAFPEHLRQYAPLIMASLLKTDAARDISDVGRMTDIAYQPAVQQMERGTQNAVESTRGAMALSGMGQGTAM